MVARGRLQYIGSVRGWDDPAYLKLANKLEELDADFKARPVVRRTARKAHLYTEGPTDAGHVRAALAFFHTRDEFTHLSLVIDEETDRGSDQRLKEYCERLKEFGSKNLAVCLFDSDTKIARDAVGYDGWQSYGPKVVAVGLAQPPWRDWHAPLCIELLYKDDILKTKDAEGRRIFLASEFNETTSLHESEPCAVPHATKGKQHLIEQDVYEFGTKASVARSKAAFARAVEHEPESFDGLSFEGFRPTLERIADALASLDPPLGPPA